MSEIGRRRRVHHGFMTFGFQGLDETERGKRIDVRRCGFISAGIIFMRQAHKGRRFDELLITLAGDQRDQLAFQMLGIGPGGDNAARAFIADR